VTHRQVRTVALRDLDATKLEAALKQPRPLILTLRLDSSDPARLSMLVDHLQRSHPCGLLLSGGDTARLFCQFAEIQELRLAGEVETGFPWATVPEGRFAGMVLATKAGGFGKVDSLSRWIDWISQGTSGSRCE
jgi:hypothetical protein